VFNDKRITRYNMYRYIMNIIRHIFSSSRFEPIPKPNIITCTLGVLLMITETKMCYTYYIVAHSVSRLQLIRKSRKSTCRVRLLIGSIYFFSPVIVFRRVRKTWNQLNYHLCLFDSSSIFAELFLSYFYQTIW